MMFDKFRITVAVTQEHETQDRMTSHVLCWSVVVALPPTSAFKIVNHPLLLTKMDLPHPVLKLREHNHFA